MRNHLPTSTLRVMYSMSPSCVDFRCAPRQQHFAFSRSTEGGHRFVGGLFSHRRFRCPVAIVTRQSVGGGKAELFFNLFVTLSEQNESNFKSLVE
jgi:hypothetical protein